MSYDPGQSTDLDKVRFKIQDTDPFQKDQWLFADEEIEAVLAEQGSVLKTALELAKVLCARFSQRVTFNIGGDSRNYSDQVALYEKLILQIQQDIDKGSGVGLPGASPSAISHKRAFHQGMMHYPGT
jgi:hypothetical protein